MEFDSVVEVGKTAWSVRKGICSTCSHCQQHTGASRQADPKAAMSMPTRNHDALAQLGVDRTRLTLDLVACPLK